MLGIHKPVAVLNKLIKTGFCVVDGICGDLTFEEGGNPVVSNRIIAGRDPLMIDSLCATLIGYHPDEIGYLAYGKELGVGRYLTDADKAIELGAENKPSGGAESARGSPAADRYRSLIDEQAACSACYASLIYALRRMGGEVNATGKIHIGQGFKGKSGAGVGIGNCACGFDTNVKGCPPTAVDIVNTLR